MCYSLFPACCRAFFKGFYIKTVTGNGLLQNNLKNAGKLRKGSVLNYTIPIYGRCFLKSEA
jgi:hypothetical protein